MRRLKKLCAGAICICLMAAVLCGCGAAPEEAAEELNVYATFYPLYAIAEMILKDVPDARLNCLVQPQDGCLRSYALSDWDFALLSRSADAVIAGGSGLESFDSLLYAMGDSGPSVMEVLTNMELCTQEAVNDGDEEGESHWQDANPHIYMSVDGAIEIARRIAASFETLDPRYAERYVENLEEAQNRLKSLKEELVFASSGIKRAKVAVLNEALVYAAREYDLEIALCYARESGEALEGAALEELMDRIRESGAEAVLIEKQAPQALVSALKAAGIPVAALDTMSTRRAEEGSEGYFDAQRANARELSSALASNIAQSNSADSEESE